MSTDTKGTIYINFAEDNGFDAGASVVSAADKIKAGKGLSMHEEYAIEVLWHEILHNKTKNTTMLPGIEDVHGFARVALETTHQFYARKTYPDFLKKLGGIAKHENWILENGLGYAETVDNLRKMLRALKINEDVFSKQAEKLLMGNYADFDAKIRKLITKLGKRKDDWSVAEVFNMLERKEFGDYLKILD